MPRTAEVVHRGADLLGEGPVWDDRTGRLYRVDTVAGAVLALDLAAVADQRWEAGEPVGCVALRADGDGLVAGVSTGFTALDTTTGAFRPLAGSPAASHATRSRAPGSSTASTPRTTPRPCSPASG